MRVFLLKEKFFLIYFQNKCDVDYIETRIPSGIWSCLYGWTVHGLYQSYTGLEGSESRESLSQSQAA